MFAFLFISSSYMLANLYVYLKLRAILAPGLWGSILLGLVIVFLTLSPTLVQIYNFRGTARTASIFSHIGFLWFGFLIPFFSCAVVLELYNYVVYYGGLYVGADTNGMRVSDAFIFLMSLGLSIAVTIYGYFEAKKLCIERLTVRTTKLPAGVERVRIVQIADLHLGIVVKDEILNRVIKIIESEKPDIVVSTGDLVDGVIHHIESYAAKLKAIQPRLGKYAVLGNHEIYGGLKHTSKFITESGFRLLRGEGATIENVINIAGMDFLGGEVKRVGENPPDKHEWKILSQLPRNMFTLLLKHRSDIEEKSLGLFDLQLSGHTHKGQIFPIGIVIQFIFQYISGFTQLLNGSAIYVSRGAGTAGPPVRVFAKPEVTVIDIMRA